MTVKILQRGVLFVAVHLQAFARRERATVLVANMKASMVALYYQHRVRQGGGRGRAGGRRRRGRGGGGGGKGSTWCTWGALPAQGGCEQE